MTFLTNRGQPYEYEETERRLKLFSVSQIRKVMHDGMAGIPPSVLEPARVRGTLLHQRFWRMLAWRAGLCDFPPLIAAYPGQCRAMDEWAARNQVQPVKLEEPSMNAKLGYAGCVDTLCLYGDKQLLTLADLKSGGAQITDPAQLLAYNEMEGYQSEQLLDLYVHEDGTFTEQWITTTDKIVQWPWFLSALNVLKARRNHGIKS